MQLSSDVETLAAEFHSSLLSYYETAARKCGYREPRFLDMVTSRGAVWAARRVLRTGIFLFGVTELGRCRCHNYSMEALVLDPRFSDLFTEEELTIAQARLQSS
jgi:hypothetical protein